MTFDELQTLMRLFAYYTSLGEKAIGQVDDAALFEEDKARSSSIADIVQHLHGNRLLRWTDLCAPGWENPGREDNSVF